MRNRFDYASKVIGQRALGPYGTTVTQAEITTETQYADLRYEPDPERDIASAGLGLLGRFGAQACLLEVYSEAPGAAELRACLVKHLTAWQQRARAARRQGPAVPEDGTAPFLWILAAGAPVTLLSALGHALTASGDWPVGVYFFCAQVLRVGIVVASELPRDESTLLVRLMAGGRLMASAVREVAALPADAPARVIAEPVLLQLQHLLGAVPDPDPDEQEFIMAMIKSWEESRAEARREGFRELFLRLLRQRFGREVDAGVEARIAAASVEQIEAWTERLLTAPTLAALLAD